MSKYSLKKVIREHVESKTLSTKQMQSLLDLQKENNVNQKNQFKKTFQWLTVAAVVFIAIGNFYYFDLLPGNSLEQQIGSEVAKNHIKLKPLEIQTSNINKIREFFSELDFLPQESTRLKSSSKTLIGGRYCSIQGVTAAQLRLKDSKTGQVQSLYQTVYDKNIFSDLPELKENQKPITVYSKGLAVDIWVEKGLLFAITRDVSSK